MKKIHNVIALSVFVLGLTVALMSLLPALTFEGANYAGYEVAFGRELINVNPFDLGSIASAHLTFSFTALLAFSLPLAAGVWVVVSRKLTIVPLVMLIVALVMFIRFPKTVEILAVFAGDETDISVDWTMGDGLIAAIVLTATAVLPSGALVFNEYWENE